MSKCKVQTNDEKLQSIKDTTRVPNPIINYKDISVQARFLWIELWKYCWGGENNKAWPGMEKIAENLGVTKNTIRNYRKELEKENLLTVERLGLGKTNRYYLHYPDPKKVQDQGLKNQKVKPEKSNGSHSKKDKGNNYKGKNKDSSLNPKEKYNQFAPLNGNGLDYDKIKDKWNSKVPDKVNIRNMTDNRKDKLRIRFKEPDFNLNEIINDVNKSSFLIDDLNPNLFTWLIKNQDNYTKILEGSYKDNGEEKVTASTFEQNKDRGADQW